MSDDSRAAVDSLELADGIAVTVRPEGDGWAVGAVAQTPTPTPRAGDGVSQALLHALSAAAAVTSPAIHSPSGRFGWHRIATPPPVRGERPIEADHTHRCVIVGDPAHGPAALVKWWPRLTDRPNPAPLLLAHLARVGHRGVPVTYGALTWSTPTGHQVPCAMAFEYLPGAQDGWTWCVRAAERDLEHGDWGPGFPARLGLLVADLHLALATGSELIPQPVLQAGTGTIQDWHRTALDRLQEAIRLAGGPPLADTAVRQELVRRESAIVETLDALFQLDRTPIQPVHGDLHVGQVLRWSGGMAVVDFDGNPIAPQTGLPARQPAARDIAQFLRSLDHVARVVDRRAGFALGSAVDLWSRRARSAFLAAYRGALARAGRSELLDLRLLSAMEAEQLCREFVYAARHLPRWAYAPLAGLRDLFPEDDGDGT